MDQNKKDILKHFKDSGHGFETPEGYFEELERQLEKKVTEKSSKRRQIVADSDTIPAPESVNQP